jgi:phosphate uptake regulator
VGTEIVTDTPTDLTLQVLLSYPELSVMSVLRRMSLITSSMHQDAITALQNLDPSLAKDVITNDDEVDRFHLYVVRQLKMAVQQPRIIKEIGLTNARECLGSRLITKSVERAADHASNIAKNVLTLTQRVSETVLQPIQQMSDIAIRSFQNAMEAFFKRDYNLAEAVIKQAEETLSLEQTAVSSLNKVDTKDDSVLRLVIESVKRTAESSSDIAEIVLNLTVESLLTS